MTEREIADLALRLNSLERTVETQTRYLGMLAHQLGYWLSEEGNELVLLKENPSSFERGTHIVATIRKP